MQITQTSIPSTPLPVAPHRPGTWAAVSLAVLVLALSLALGDARDDALALDVQAFQQRVAADVGPTVSPAAVLAQRYLGELSMEQRQRISEQVREEQRAGLTPAGNRAFVMRRLALYEAALPAR